MNQTSITNGPQIDQQSIKNGSNIVQQSAKIEVWGPPGQGWRRLGPSWAILGDPKRLWRHLRLSWKRLGGVLERSWGLLGGFGPIKVANMVPTWLPKWSQDGTKTHPKIDHLFGVSWNRFVGGFLWILDSKMEPSWHQNGIKNRYQL